MNKLHSLVAVPGTTGNEGRCWIHRSSYDPAFVREVHASSEALVAQAVEAAAEFMAKERFRERHLGGILGPLRALGAEILANAEKIADIEARWTSRSWQELARQSLPKAAETIDWFCDIAESALGRFENLPRGTNWEYREDPLGVVAAITPWNDPLVAFAWKVVPALIAGNCVVWKPSENCPESACWVVERLYALGLARERLQLLLGDREVGEALVRTPIQAVSFTGSSRTARRIAATANESRLVKMHIEAGGKGVAVIGPGESDTALKGYVDILCEAAFSNQGQICSAPTIIFAPDGSLDRLIGLFQSAAACFAPGDPTDRGNRIGGLVSLDKKLALAELVAMDDFEDVTLTVTGDPHHGFDPTLIVRPPRDSRVVTEELFGPIITVFEYGDLDEAITFINRQEYGLANGVFSGDPAIQRHFTHTAGGGILHVNSWGTDPVGVPFGGTKNSGFGKEKSCESITFFTTLKPVCRTL